MGGNMALLAAGGASLSLTLTTGQQTFSAKGSFLTETGFATAAQSVTGVAFGSLSVGTWNGFTIIGLYNSTSNVGNGGTVFVVSGDASSFSPSIVVDGVSQNTGPGSFGGGKTEFDTSSVTTDPFGAVSSTHNVVIYG